MRPLPAFAALARSAAFRDREEADEAREDRQWARRFASRRGGAAAAVVGALHAHLLIALVATREAVGTGGARAVLRARARAEIAEARLTGFVLVARRAELSE